MTQPFDQVPEVKFCTVFVYCLLASSVTKPFNWNARGIPRRCGLVDKMVRYAFLSRSRSVNHEVAIPVKSLLRLHYTSLSEFRTVLDPDCAKILQDSIISAFCPTLPQRISSPKPPSRTERTNQLYSPHPQLSFSHYHSSQAYPSSSPLNPQVAISALPHPHQEAYSLPSHNPHKTILHRVQLPMADQGILCELRSHTILLSAGCTHETKKGRGNLTFSHSNGPPLSLSASLHSVQ